MWEEEASVWSQGCGEAGEWWLLGSRQEVLGRVVVSCRGEKEGQRREYGSEGVSSEASFICLLPRKRKNYKL